MHKFGDNHTEQKLQAVSDYLKAYTTALKNQHFKTIYIDACAGNGTRLAAEEIELLSEEAIILPGSAINALNTTPCFNEYHFIEEKLKFTKELKAICDEYPALETTVHRGDVNEVLPGLLSHFNPKRDRAVIFLDPYGSEIKWETLEFISKLQGIDVWYLFPTMALFRNAGHNLAKIPDYKKEMISQLLGTDKWEELLYIPNNNQLSLFGSSDNKERIPVKNMDAIIMERLQTLFKYVHEPLPLHIGTGAQGFSLFLALTNPRGPAINLAKKLAASVLSNAS